MTSAGAKHSGALRVAGLSAFVGLSAFGTLCLWSAPADSHSWMFISAWGSLDKATLRCDDGLCRVRMKLRRVMDTESAERRAPVGRRASVDVWLEPGQLRGHDTIADIEAHVAKLAAGPVRVHGRLDSFDDDDTLDLKADAIAASPTKGADKTPFAACGTPPWTPENLDRCSKKVKPRVAVKMTAVLEAPAARPARRFIGVVSLRDAKSDQPMYWSNPWGLVSKHALVLYGRRAAKLDALPAGSAVTAHGYFALPRREKHDGKLQFVCPDDMCWPRLIVTAIRAKKKD